MTETASGASGKSRGLLASLGALAASLVAIAHTRLDMLALDIEEGRDYVLSLLLLGIIGLFCFGVGVVLATILIVALFWDTHRIVVLGTLTGFFLVAGVVAWAVIMQKAKVKPRLFAGSLSELLKDREQLSSEP